MALPRLPGAPLIVPVALALLAVGAASGAPAAPFLLRALPTHFKGTLYADLEAVRRDLPGALDSEPVRCQLDLLRSVGLGLPIEAVDRLAASFPPVRGGFRTAVMVLEGPQLWERLRGAVRAAGHEVGGPASSRLELAGPGGRMRAAALRPDRVIVSVSTEGEAPPLTPLEPGAPTLAELYPDLGRQDAYLQLRLRYDPPVPEVDERPAKGASTTGNEGEAMGDPRGLIRRQVYLKRQIYDLYRDGVTVRGSLKIEPHYGIFGAFGLSSFGANAAARKARDMVHDRRDTLPEGPARRLLDELEVGADGGDVDVRFAVSRNWFSDHAAELGPLVSGTIACTPPRLPSAEGSATAPLPPAAAFTPPLRAAPPEMSSWLW